MAEAVTQTNFRVRTDTNAAMGTIVWAAAQNVNAVIQPGVPFRLRLAIQNTGTIQTGSYDWYLMVSKNGGAYQQIVAGLPVSTADPTGGVSPSGTHLNAALTTAPQVTFYSTTGSISFSKFLLQNAGDHAELEYGLILNGAMINGGDSFQFRIYKELTTPLETYTVTPSFAGFPMSGALAIVEGGDVLTATAAVFARGSLTAVEANDALVASAGPVAAAHLSVTEAADVLVGGAAGTQVIGTLNIPEGADALAGHAGVVPLGGVGAILTIVEANDAMSGAGLVRGFAGVLSIVEQSDILLGVGIGRPAGAILNVVENNDVLFAAGLLAINQWVPAVGCPPTTWVSVDCNAPIIFPPPLPSQPPPIVPGEGEMLQMEQLPVLGVNSIGNFSHLPNMDLCTLTVDGRPFFPVGAFPDFAVSGNAVTWLNPVYSVAPGSTVIASYTRSA